MMDFLRKHQIYIFVFLITVILFGAFMGFGAYTFGDHPGDSIAEVNGHKIPMRIFYSHYNRILDSRGGASSDAAARQQVRDETVRDLVQGQVFAEQAERYGIEVPDQQVVISLTQIPAFQENGHFNPQLYMQALQSTLRLAPKDFEEEQRKSIAFFKLRWLMQSAIKLTDHEFAIDAPIKAAGKLPKNDKEKETLRTQILQEKMLYSLNQWYMHIGSTLKVKTHFELLEGTR
jgi:peptidyl-prolyl cis-trans isomerase D